MEQVVNENTNVEQTEQKPKKQSGKGMIVGIILGILAMIATLMTQIIVSSIGVIVLQAQCISEVGGDAAAVQALYMQKLTETGFLTNMTFIATAAEAMVVLLWYKLAFVKKYTSLQKAEFRSNVLKGKIVGSLVLAGVGCYSLAVLIAGVVGLISPASMENFTELMGATTSGNEVISFLTLVILAPIAEEVAFRGIILRILSKRTSTVAAIIISAVLFGIFHMNVMQAIYVLPLGLVLGCTAYKCKSVLPCILIHMVNNFMPSLVGVLPESVLNEFLFVGIFVICAVVLFFLWKKPNKIVE